LSGTNTYTGTTTISAGVLSVATIGNGGVAGNLGQATNAAANLVLGGGTLQYTGATASTDRAFTLTAATTSSIDVTTNTLTISGAAANTSGALTKIGSGTLLLSGANAYTGTTTISVGTLKTQGSAFSGTPRTWSISSGAVLNTDGTTGVATGTTTINGAGTLRITGGTFSNGVGSGRNITMSMSSGGLIDIQAGATLLNGGWQNITWTANLASMNVDGNLDVWDGLNIYIDALTGSGTITRGSNFAPTTTIFVGVNNGSGTFSGVISNGVGSILLTKNGSGTQTLSGANTYTGATTVNAGTLLLTGSLASGSAVTVANGGTLKGTGTVNGSLTANSGGTVGPGLTGVAIGTLNTAAVTLQAGSTMSIDLSSPGPTADKLASVSTISLSGGLTIASQAAPAASKTYTIMTATTSITGTFTGKANNSVFTANGSRYRIVYNATSVVLTSLPRSSQGFMPFFTKRAH
jgi:fibronectin-binding autotransporter adhesin